MLDPDAKCTYWPPLLCPIIPMNGIGGIRLGMTLQDVLQILGEPLVHFVIPGNKNKLVYYGLTVLLSSNDVYSVFATPGYQGATPEGLTVNTPWKRLLELYPDVKFDETDKYLWHVSDINGSIEMIIVRPPTPTEPCSHAHFDWAPMIDELYEVINPAQAYVWGIGMSKKVT